MTDRTVRVTLIAQATGYVAGMDQAARKTRELGSEAERLAQKRAAFEGLGRGFLAVGIAAAAGVGLAIAKFAEFDQAMSQVQAVTQETADGQKSLWDAALEAGGKFPQTAREAANAEEELAKAGISTADILSGALTSSLQLANAGQLEVARSAEITGITLKQFGLEGKEASRVADVLAAGANKAVGGVEDLAQGLKFVGPVADSMNVSLEDTVATLALFADRGVIGEQAGTSLRGMLASLTSPSKEAKKEIDRLGISLYDGQGRFLGLENAAGQLNTSLAGVADSERDMSLGLIFGNQQVTAARILVDAGASTWRDYRAAVDDSGIAARIAAERMDNLAGDVEKLGGSLDTALIQTGSGANDVLRDLVQTATFLVDSFGEVPAPVLGVGLAVLSAAAAVGILGGAALLAIPRIADLRLWMSNAGVSAGGLATGLGGATLAIGLATYALAAFAAREAGIAAGSEALEDSLESTTGAFTDYSRELVSTELQTRGAFDAAKKFGVSQRDLVAAVIEGGDALDALRQKSAAYAATGPDGVRTAKDFEQAIQDVRREIDGSAESWQNESAANADAAAANQQNTDTLSAMGVAASGASGDVSALADQIRGLADVTLSSRDAERQFQAAVDDATAAFQRNGATLDINTDAGRENEAALDAIAKAAKDAAAATYEQTQSEGAATQEIQAGRDALIAQLAQYYITGQAAENYADSLGLIPANIGTLVSLNTSAAQQEIDRFIRLNNGRTVRVNGVIVTGPGFADGGFTGSGGRNQVAGFVHAGEFVSDAQTVAKPENRAALEYMHAGGTIRGYADGGFVTSPAGPTWRPAPAAPVVVQVVNNYAFPNFLGFDKAATARQIDEIMAAGRRGGDISVDWGTRG